MKRLIWSLVLALTVFIILAMITTPTPSPAAWLGGFRPWSR